MASFFQSMLEGASEALSSASAAIKSAAADPAMVRQQNTVRRKLLDGSEQVKRCEEEHDK